MIESKLTILGPLPWGYGGHDKRRNPVNDHIRRDASRKKFSIVALALVALVGSAVGLYAANSETFTGADASLGPNQPGYKVYDHVVKATPPAMGEHKFRLVVPEGLAVVRGILVVGPYSGGDSRDYYQQAWYREFLHLHGFAFLGAKDFYMHDYKVLQNALKQLATDSKHPELVHAPFAATGFSAGGGAARRLLMEDPERLIAAVIVGSTLKLNGKPEAANLGTPVCVINGDLEHELGEAGGMAKAL